ncbi:MAG: nitroreductase family protein [Defluviitaleaceae bacterium]|nr:nitroreductase family protein [Defluviitaleaceae bacterium]
MITAINERRSIRKFQPDMSVTKEQLNQLLHAAMLAPSAKNSRPWEFIAITKREILDEFARSHPFGQMFKTATAAIVVVALPQPEPLLGYFPQDCGAASQNILLEAVEMGLGTCWLGIWPKEPRMTWLSELLDIREPKVPFNIIAIGVPDENPKQRGFFEESKVAYIG